MTGGRSGKSSSNERSSSAGKNVGPSAADQDAQLSAKAKLISQGKKNATITEEDREDTDNSNYK